MTTYDIAKQRITIDRYGDVRILLFVTETRPNFSTTRKYVLQHKILQSVYMQEINPDVDLYEAGFWFKSLDRLEKHISPQNTTAMFNLAHDHIIKIWPEYRVAIRDGYFIPQNFYGFNCSRFKYKNNAEYKAAVDKIREELNNFDGKLEPINEE